MCRFTEFSLVAKKKRVLEVDMGSAGGTLGQQASGLGATGMQAGSSLDPSFPATLGAPMSHLSQKALLACPLSSAAAVLILV